MTVSSMTPSAATAALYASQPAFGGTNAGAAAYPVTGGVASATAGAANVAAKPSIGARLLNAMKAALSELRGGSVPQAASPLLPAGQALVASPRSAGAVETLGSTAVGATPGAAAGANSETPPVRHLKASSLTAKQKAAVKARVAAQKAAEERAPVGSIGPVGAVGPTGAAGAAGFNQGGLGSLGALPANATQLPNATVYSYDQNGNPAVAGLQGLPSATQAQLGILPQFGNQIDGLTGSPTVPQVNQTNQTSLPAAVGGMAGVAGVATPVLGAPIYNPPVSPVAPGLPTAGAGQGNASTQAVTSRNSNDQSARNEQPGLGYGYGANGMALPYGSSMTGYSPGQQGGISGFFARLFG